MKDPARLLDEGATAAELSLLRAGMSEEPSEQAARRLAVALGLGSGAAVSTIAMKSNAAGAVARGAASKFAAKWVLVGALGVASGAAILAARGHASPEARATARGSSPVAGGTASEVAVPSAPIAGGTPNEVAAAPAEPRAAKVNAGGSAPDAPEVPTSSVAANPAPARSSPSIAREIASLDVARQKLGGGDTRGALDALDTYDRASPSGVLRQEATLLRIEALARGGNLSIARRLAARFLREHPRSPHEMRIRTLVGETP
jgi:hypothetical protein